MKRVSLVLVVLCGVSLAQDVAPAFDELGNAFYFVINADPQMGPKDSAAGNERHLYDLLRQFVEETNAREPAPAFVLFNGDLVAHAKPAYFEAFTEVAEEFEPPVVLVHGNHDGRHPDESFLDVQEALSGYRKLWYSFDAGQWHFVVLPAKEQLPDRETEQAMLDWLRADLEAHADRPTMAFLHYHLLPIGLSQGEYYTLPMDLKKDLVDLFTRQKQVRYVISGHVHTGIQSSIKTSWTYKDTVFLIAPSPVSPRSFGEEFPEFLPEGEANEGYYLDVHIDGEDVRFVGRKIGSEVTREYPKTFPEFTAETDPRAFTPVGELPENDTLQNGSFEEGFNGWHAPHRYRTDEAPGFVACTAPFDVSVSEGARVGHHRHCDERVFDEACPPQVGSNLEDVGHLEPSSIPDTKPYAAYLRTHEKGHAWAYDEFLEYYQLVAVLAGGRPVFTGRYRVCAVDKSDFGGGYIRLTAYAGGKPQCYFFFHWGAREERANHLTKAILYSDTGSAKGISQFHALAEQQQVLHWLVPDYPNQWHTLSADLATLFDTARNTPGAFEALAIDKLLIAYGTWCGMEHGSHSGAWFDDFTLSFEGEGESKVDDKALYLGPDVFDPPYGKWYLWGYDK